MLAGCFQSANNATVWRWWHNLGESAALHTLYCGTRTAFKERDLLY
jgi:hypothetical protein